jgi:glycosyltransferase involved in cell wall biosynthesis
MRVLFVSGIDGPCHRYQVLHRAAQLRRRGAAVEVRSFRDPAVPAEAPEHDLVFLYRVPATESVRAAVERAHRRGRRLIGTIDDLVFSPDGDALPRLDHLPPAERALWRRGVERYRATLAACDGFLGPTEPLVREAAALGWDAHLHRNSIAPAELALATAAMRPERRGRAEVVLGYFSGTPTHDDDFASIAPALARVFRRHEHVRLAVLGPLRLDPLLEPFRDRIERRPAVAWDELPAAVAAVDVSLAPIDTSRRFATAKGEVKYLEAAAVATPTVASSTPAFRHAIGDDARGRLAGDVEAWCQALDDLVRDEELRRDLGARARADVLERWSEERRADELWREIERIDGHGPAPAISLALAEPERPAALALEPDACPALPPATPAATTPPLGSGRRLVQTFRPTRNGLCRVDVHSVTFGQDLRHELRITLRGGGRVLAEERCDASGLPDRGWFALDVPPESHSAGNVYELELEARGTGPGNATSFGLADQEDGISPAADGARTTAARFADEPLAAPLALRCFAAWEQALPGIGSARRVSA